MYCRATEPRLAETGALADTIEGVDGLAVEQAEIAGAVGQLGAAQGFEGPVEHPRSHPDDGCVRGAVATLAIDNVVARVPAGNEIGDHLGRVLQITVHDDHTVAAGMLETGGYRDLLAEVAAEGNRLIARVAGIHFA